MNLNMHRLIINRLHISLFKGKRCALVGGILFLIRGANQVR